MSTLSYITEFIPNHHMLVENVGLPQSVLIPSTSHTPQVRYSSRLGLLWIKGNCDFPLGTIAFGQALELIEEHLLEKDYMRIVFDIKKINASGVKQLMNIFNRLKNLDRSGKQITVSWLTAWQNDELYELAFDLMELYELKMELRPY